MQVNAETLQAKIDILEMLKQERSISLNGEYQLEAYKMLLKYLEHEQETACLYGAEDLTRD